MLRSAYPEKTDKQIRAQAVYTAARKHKIAHESLITFLGRPPGDRRHRLGDRR